jgi:hypothetical protein
MCEFKRMELEVYLAEILRARRMTPGERLSEAFELTDAWFANMREGIRRENPQADEAEVFRLERERMAKIRAAEEEGIYGPPVPRL